MGSDKCALRLVGSSTMICRVEISERYTGIRFRGAVAFQNAIMELFVRETTATMNFQFTRFP